MDSKRHRYGSRGDWRENSGPERRQWGRRSPERDKHRDTEDRGQRAGGHRDRDGERDSRDRESRREKEEARAKEKAEGAHRAAEAPPTQAGSADPVPDLAKGAPERAPAPPAEERPAEATSPADPEKAPSAAKAR